MSFSGDVSLFLQSAEDRAVALDSMGFSYSLMTAEWEKLESREQLLHSMMEGSCNLQLPAQLFELVCRWQGGRLGGPPALASPSVGYKKLGMLLDFVELHGIAGDASTYLLAIERFGADIGQWLKVAGDSKALLVEASMRRRKAWSAEVCVELGTFVGYTAMRLARWAGTAGDGPGRCVHLEVDPIHALITKHQLSLAALFNVADVWVGQALDLIPRLPEEFGTMSLCLAFMDHRGTKFHSDLFRAQKHNLFAPGATHVCDNTLKPGAPLCLWLMAYDPLKCNAVNWSLQEFAHWRSEDWMLVNVLD